MKRWLPTAALIALMGSAASGQDFTVQENDTIAAEDDFSPFVDRHYPDRVYWGDTHLHTANSPDAGLVGNTLGPAEAYRFARGEEVKSSGGLRVKLIRPLDFLVVSDHSEYMGLAPMLVTGDPNLLADPVGKRWYDMFNDGQEQAYAAFREAVQSVTEGNLLIDNPAVMRSVWQENNATADSYNEPGKFTAFIGYEWSSIPGGNNLHRVVVFRDDASKVNQVVPFSSMDSPVARIRLERLRQPEVQHLHGAVIFDLHIGWFQIPMDDALLVRGFQGFGDLLGYRQSLVNGDRPLLDALGQRRPFDQLKDQRPLPFGFFQPVDVPDVGMVQ